MGRALDVLLVVPNLAGGGAEGAMLRYAAALVKHGHRAQLMLLEAKGDYTAPPGVEIHVLGRSPLGSGRMGIWHSGRRLRRWCAANRGARPFDLVISTLTLADEVVAAARIDNVHHRVANTLSATLARLAETKPALARQRHAALTRLYRGRSLISVSAGVAADLRAMLGADTRVAVIANPFDFAAIAAKASAPEPDLPAEPFILHVGRFNPQKRHDLLLEAYVRSGVPHRLVLMSADRVGLSRLLQAMGLLDRVTLAGFRDNPFPWYKSAAAVVLASDYEGMPNVLIEAMACGTPVVSTDCPSGPAELLTGRLAPFLVPCRDSGALADALQRVTAAPPAVDPGLVAGYSEAAFVAAIERLAAGQAGAVAEVRP